MNLHTRSIWKDTAVQTTVFEGTQEPGITLVMAVALIPKLGLLKAPHSVISGEEKIITN